MRFVVIDARLRIVVPIAANSGEIYELAGLDTFHVDHAVVARSPETGIGIAIAVHEHGLFQPPADCFYFSVGRKMYAGNAVLYAFDGAGRTIDMPAQPPPVMFYRSHRELEAAIERGEIDRPQTLINNIVVWRWPDQHSYFE